MQELIRRTSQTDLWTECRELGKEALGLGVLPLIGRAFQSLEEAVDVQEVTEEILQETWDVCGGPSRSRMSFSAIGVIDN